MTRVLVDTSAFLALLVAEDVNHRAAAMTFGRLSATGSALVVSSYVLVETYALLGRRFGPDVVRAFRENLEPLVEVYWVDAALHGRGLDMLLAAQQRDLSLVDCVSFCLAREASVDAVFAFDRHFDQRGFVKA